MQSSDVIQGLINDVTLLRMQKFLVSQDWIPKGHYYLDSYSSSIADSNDNTEGSIELLLEPSDLGAVKVVVSFECPVMSKHLTLEITKRYEPCETKEETIYKFFGTLVPIEYTAYE